MDEKDPAEKFVERFIVDAVNRPGLRQYIEIPSVGIVWMAVHGYLCLALRHPKAIGPSRTLVLSFTRSLGRKLVAAGVLTLDELKLTEKTEADESPHGGG